MQIEYRVGDTVIYNRGPSAERVGLSRTVKATVTMVSTESDEAIPFSQPIYTIEWPPRGYTTVFAHDLSAPTGENDGNQG